AQVANAARNYEILHEMDDEDTERPDKCPGVPLRDTLIYFALLVDVDTKESVVELQFDDKIRAINAFPLDMCEFDIILDHFSFASTYLTISWL
nr:hypothetical protein [Tanacetum cinerariifolium]